MNRPPLRPLASLLLIALLSACSTTHFQSETLARPRETPGILLMPLDVELSEVNAGGVTEPKADWTDQARGNMTAALRDIMAGRRANVVVFDDSRLWAPMGPNPWKRMIDLPPAPKVASWPVAW